MVRGLVVVQILSMGVPAMTNIDKAPVSAMECESGTVNVTVCGIADAALWLLGDTFDATIVTLSIALRLLGSKV
jgi:hypothetical protein